MPIAKFTAKQRLIIIISIGFIILLITIYTTPSEVVVAPTLPNKKTTDVVKTSNKAVMPIGHQDNQTNQVIRDPFAIPPEYKEQMPVANNLKKQMDSILPANSNNGPTTVAQVATPPAKTKDLIKLTGIVSSNNQHMAVIQTANKSKAYYLNELIGDYQIIAIMEDQVILKNDDSQLVLPLDSARQKGDNK
jgi:type II secretory pathway component PulC